MSIEIIEKIKYLIVKIDGESYALVIDNVLEILTSHNITKIPNVPNYVRGIMNLRGQIVPVVDVSKIFETPNRLSDRKCFIVVEFLEFKVAIMADEVMDVKEVDPSEIQKNTSSDENDFINGILCDEQSSYIVLDLIKLLPPLIA